MSPHWHAIAPLFLFLSVAVAPSSAQSSNFIPPKHDLCYRATFPITIDGKLDDAPWNAAPWTDDFVDIEGDRKPRPQFRTRAKMLWDEHFFYVAAELQEPHVWATLTQHDAVIFHDNDFEVFIDPDGDNHEYYEFEMNALNTGWDLFLTRPYKDGGAAINAWEIPGLKTAVHVQGTLNDPNDQDVAWSVELAFPWSVLKEAAHKTAPPADGDQWRVNFSRVEWQTDVIEGKYRKVPNKREDNWVWSPQGVIDMHRPETWAYVQFTTAPPGQTTFQPDHAAQAKQLLHRVYYAQRAFREQHGRWATSPQELEIADHYSMQTTNALFEVAKDVRLPNGTVQRWRISQDSRVWVE